MEPLQREKPHHQSPLHPSLKVPGRRALLQVPQMVTLWKEMPVCRAFSTHPSGSPARKPSLQVPFTELPQRGTPHLHSPFQPYLKIPGRWAHSRLPNWAPIKRDAHPQNLPFITFRAPRRSPPLVSPNRAPIEKDAPFPETPYNNLSEFLVNGSPWGGFRPLSPPPHILPNPQKGSPLTAPTERDAPFPEPSKNTQSVTPQVPQRAPEARDASLQKFLLHLSLKVSGKWTPTPRSLLRSLWREKLHLQSQWFILSFMYVGVPNKEPSHEKTGKNIWPPSTEPHVDGRPTYNGVRPSSPRGSLTTMLSLPQCHAAFSTIPSTLVLVDQSPVSQPVSWQPSTGYALHNCYRLPRDPGYSSIWIYNTPRYGRGVGFMGGYLSWSRPEFI